ncbi:hypothetical protein [Mesorhizobium retamae]|uniref:DUF2190 domain-containing protein n=1 Tax=Mesorhizobium retamae TaxID=2912854 RepID=A0ABS9QI18_9HYPH|nr:hypothetical protein [Mesorhizobium sp. IRAMC:0171]MCG7507065.1 hypothetical protein [Mesorhizobium sp. IRAMC:0171]
MADLTITAANVVAGSNARTVHGVAGVAITAGQVVYLSPTSGKYELADTDSATAAVRSAHGIALNGAALNQPISVITEGDVTIGATIEAGTAYYLSGTAGGICPVADVAAGDYPLILGMGKSTTVLAVNIQYPGVVKA